MNSKTVLCFVIIVLLSMKMFSCEKKRRKVKKAVAQKADGDKKVKVTNWNHYGWKSDQEVDAKVLVKILNSLALFERGEDCPFGKGKCESVSAVSVLNKLIREMLNVKKTNEDCEKTGDCGHDIKEPNKAAESLERSETPTEGKKLNSLKKGLEESSTNPHNIKLLFVSINQIHAKSKLFSG